MTFDAIERGAHHYNRHFGIAFTVLRGIAMFFAVLAVIAILRNGYGPAGIFISISVGLLFGSQIVPYSRTERDLLGRYITHLLIEASAQKNAKISKDVEAARTEKRRCQKELTRLRRNRKIALELCLANALEKNKDATEKCLSDIAKALQTEKVMKAELDGFYYELGELMKKAVRAIDAHLAATTPSLIEKTEFARYINGLIANAKRL